MRTPETVAAIAEDDARGDTARIYAEIRETIGIVNLIWRHLATIDGALGWAWAALGPAYASGAITAHADHLRATARSLLQPIEAVPSEVLHCLGLSDKACRAIADIVASYDRGNAANLVATEALLQRVGAMPGLDEAATPAVSRAPTGKGRRKAALPSLAPILALQDLDGPTAALVGRLNELCSTHDRPILVSIYRHLGHWPAFLALAWTQIAPLVANHRLDECATQIDRLGWDEAAQLAASLPPAGRHPAGEKALTEFLERIGLHRMIAITAVHTQGLGAGDR